jgi:hypothetical protein
MLDIANFGPGDYVIGLGSGNGRIVITAATKELLGMGMECTLNRSKGKF